MEENGAPIADPVVEQAIAWYVRLASGAQTSHERAEFANWQAAHADHARAWQRLQAMGGRLQGSAARIEPAVTRAVLARVANAAPARRRALKTLVWVGAGGAALHWVQDQVPWRAEVAAAMADERTAVGERRSLVLADGTRLMLNTATAVDIRFDARQRRLILRSGEIMVATARDAADRPLVVSTQDGTLTPAGTRFTVRRDEVSPRGGGATQLAVNEGAVDIRTAERVDDSPIRVRAGQQVHFTRHRVDPVTALSEASQSWTENALIAEGMALGNFIAELERYRPGRLRCAPEVSSLRITGVWPLDGSDPTEHILASLERQLPIRVNRLTRYWVTVSAR